MFCIILEISFFSSFLTYGSIPLPFFHVRFSLRWEALDSYVSPILALFFLERFFFFLILAAVMFFSLSFYHEVYRMGF